MTKQITANRLARRSLIKLSLGGFAASLLAACAPIGGAPPAAETLAAAALDVEAAAEFLIQLVLARGEVAHGAFQAFQKFQCFSNPKMATHNRS